jgi:sulfhydrogenase subunit gamma (sulfur reductase)
MYKFVLMALAEHDVSPENIFLNLERKMKCGVGKCGHCQINSSYVCMSGPVFRYSDLASLPEAI